MKSYREIIDAATEAHITQAVNNFISDYTMALGSEEPADTGQRVVEAEQRLVRYISSVVRANAATKAVIAKALGAGRGEILDKEKPLA